MTETASAARSLLLPRPRRLVALLASAVAASSVLLVAACKSYERETATIASKAEYFPTPKSPTEIPATLVDAVGGSDVLLLGEGHYGAEHHQFMALLLSRLHEHGFRMFLCESNHGYGWAFDEYVTGRRDSLTPAQSNLDATWLEAVRALNAELRASSRAQDQMRVRAIDVNHWRSVYREGALELATRSGNERLVRRVKDLPPTDTAGYHDSLESLAADLGAAKDRMGLAATDFATLGDITKVEITSARFRSSRIWKDREDAMYNAVVAAMGSLGPKDKVVIHCGMMHAQLSQVWQQESPQSWNAFGVRLAEDCRRSSKRIFSLACFGARGEQKHGFFDPERHPFDIMDEARADSLTRALDAAADGRIAFVDLRDTGVTDGVLIDFGSDASSTVCPGEQFSGMLLYPRVSVLPSSVWYETNFRD